MKKIEKTPVLVLNLEKVQYAYESLAFALPGVRLHYAVKANPHPAILQTLHRMGGDFEVASLGELELLTQAIGPKTGLFFTHPVKTRATIKQALGAGIRNFVVDNKDELAKFKGFDLGDVTLFFRMGYSSTGSKVNLARKFGIEREEDLLALIALASKVGFCQFGLSFHIGSQNLDSGAYGDALQAARALVARLRAVGYRVDHLDMGGGFPSPGYLPKGGMEAYTEVFRDEIDECLQMGIEVIAEPGRALVAGAVELHCTIIGKSIRENKPWYFLDDSIYNSFSGKWNDKAEFRFHLKKEFNSGPLVESVLAGNTCDSLDVIEEQAMLPPLDIGTQLIFEEMGAYSNVAASTFNGFPLTPIEITP